MRGGRLRVGTSNFAGCAKVWFTLWLNLFCIMLGANSSGSRGAIFHCPVMNRQPLHCANTASTTSTGVKRVRDLDIVQRKRYIQSVFVPFYTNKTLTFFGPYCRSYSSPLRL